MRTFVNETKLLETLQAFHSCYFTGNLDVRMRKTARNNTHLTLYLVSIVPCYPQKLNNHLSLTTERNLFKKKPQYDISVHYMEVRVHGNMAEQKEHYVA